MTNPYSIVRWADRIEIHGTRSGHTAERLTIPNEHLGRMIETLTELDRQATLFDRGDAR